MPPSKKHGKRPALRISRTNRQSRTSSHKLARRGLGSRKARISDSSRSAADMRICCRGEMDGEQPDSVAGIIA